MAFARDIAVEREKFKLPNDIKASVSADMAYHVSETVSNYIVSSFLPGTLL